MARNDGIDRTVARNRDLKKSDTIKGAQAHNERQKEIYSNQDIVPERTPFNVHFKLQNLKVKDIKLLHIFCLTATVGSCTFILVQCPAEV